MATKQIRREPPLIVIVGPTASGKTGLAIKLAHKFGGEIISADSRAIYKYLDIGTAKPSTEERQGVPHWGVDLVNPGERFTAADFKKYAEQKIAAIRKRGRIPILVGGTGLYINSVIYDYKFPSDSAEKRQKYLEWSIEKLQNYCNEHNINLPYNSKNRRHLISAIMRVGVSENSKSSLIDNTIVVGIATENEILRERIKKRADVIFTSGVVEEAEGAAARFGWDNEAMTGNIYPLIRQMQMGELTLDKAKERSRTLDWQLAKRQLTWFRRDENVVWLQLDEAYTYLARMLAKANKS